METMKSLEKIEKEVDKNIYLSYYRDQYERLKMLELAIEYLRSDGGHEELGEQVAEEKAQRQEADAEKLRKQLLFVKEKLCL